MCRRGKERGTGMIKRVAAAFGVVANVSTTTTGCIGGMALSGKVLGFNLSVTESR